MTSFHFSPGYQGQELILEKEVMEAYDYVLKQKRYKFYDRLKVRAT